MEDSGASFSGGVNYGLTPWLRAYANISDSYNPPAAQANDPYGIGPQVGWSFNVGGVALETNIRGYKEFAAQNRPEGWNAYLTLSLSRARRGTKD